MKFLKTNPKTNGTRHLLNLGKNVLLKSDKLFKLRSYIRENNGRSTVTGHITTWHRGSGPKTMYRPIDQDDEDKFAIIIGIGHNPFKNSLTAVSFDTISRTFSYNLAASGSTAGALSKTHTLNDSDEDASSITSNKSKLLALYQTNTHPHLGDRIGLVHAPMGAMISSIAKHPLLKSTYACSAGTSAQLIRTGEDYAIIKLSSGILKKLPKTAIATLGIMSNELHRNIVTAKAGRSRNLNRRPAVRGIAKNPVDHPHGGKTNGGRPSCSPWGVMTKCSYKLRRKKSKRINNYV